MVLTPLLAFALVATAGEGGLDRVGPAPRVALGPWTPLAREAQARLARYLRLTAPRIREAPSVPGGRFHKRDDHNEHAVRQNATVALGYAVLLLEAWDAALTGCSRDQAVVDLRGLLRYLGATHRANGGRTGDGQPWGDAWQSAFWAAIAGQAAWLADDLLDAETRRLVARAVAHEADRFLTRPPDHGVVGDTKAEENAWNSEVLALAAVAWPQHPHAAAWQERAIVYMLNGFVRAADRDSTRVVDGRPLRERLSVVTIHDDFTLENHGRVHPDYLSTSALNLRNALLYLHAGRPVPAACFFNAGETAAVLRRLTARDGGCLYVNGQDWWPHRLDVPLLLSALLSVLGGEPASAYLEQACLDNLGRMHRRFDDGRLYDAREFNYPNAEEEMIARYAELVLLHRLAGDGPQPLHAAAYDRAQAGVQVFEKGGFALHRSGPKAASFTWANGVMGLVWANGDTWLTSPSERGLIGRIAIAEAPDDAPRVVSKIVVPGPDQIAVSAVVSRCQGRLEQRLALVSLPGLPVLYLERLAARQAVTVRELATGLVTLLNEDAGPLHPNVRRLRGSFGWLEVPGATAAPDAWQPLDSAWVNVDQRLGIVGSGGRLHYWAAHRYQRARLEQAVAGCYQRDLGAVPAGRLLTSQALLLLPGQTANATAVTTLQTSEPAPGVLCASFRGQQVAANLSNAPAAGWIAGAWRQLAPGEVYVAP
ncbi:MAG: hypothetical protein IT204_10265 [Fimbriimonadaceae bacterium]|nr:hypothetical protein [Fimbriimonadaceae bacterium]